jgi:Zn-dependent protease with chaperone function
VIAAAALLCYAVVLVAAAASALNRAGWPDRAPGLAIAAWLALDVSAVASVILGGAALVLPTPRVSAGAAWLLAACAMVLRARYAHPGGAALAGAGAVLAVAVSARAAWCTVAALAVRARSGRGHRRGLRVAGRLDARLGAVVVDHDQPAAYCLPGSGHPVVVTSAAVDALDDVQLAAVLAHERAHQAGRHHLLVAVAGALADAFPRVPAFGYARDQVARLAELAADDAAAASWPRLTVAGALLAMSAAPAEATALGAGGPGAAARVRRLIAAPRPLGRMASAGAGLTVAAPLAVLAAPAVAALGTHYCPPAITTVVHPPVMHECWGAGGRTAA